MISVEISFPFSRMVKLDQLVRPIILGWSDMISEVNAFRLSACRYVPFYNQNNVRFTLKHIDFPLLTD